MAATLEISTGATEVICGESIEIRSTITNSGSAPVSIPTVSLSPVEYTLQSLTAGGPSYAASQESDVAGLRAGRPAPDLPAEVVTLSPGQSAEYRDDLALYVQRRIAPGRYRLTAKCPANGGYAEAAIPEILVAPPRIGSVSTVNCFYKHVEAAAFSHTGRNNDLWIFQEDTRTQELRTGVFYRRYQLPAGPGVTSLAVAVHTQPRLEGRWVGWLRERSFAALSGWGDALTGLVDPVSVPLDSPRLVPPGFQDADEGCLFLIAGQRGNATWIQTCRLSEMRAVLEPPVRLSDGHPPSILARGFEGGRRTAGIDLVWADERPGAAGLYGVSCAPDGRPVSPSPRRLYQRSAPMLAWNLEPYGAAAAGAVHALFGPEGDGQAVTYVRAPLDGSAAPRESRLPALPPGLKHPLQAWAISGLEPGQMRVAALAGNRIWTASASGGNWIELASAPNARDLRLLTTPYESYWGAIWTDPESGLRYAADPDFIR